MAMDRALVDSVLATPYGEAAYKVVECLMDAGFDTWWVGGCVRMLLSGTIPTDIDIATQATPSQMQDVFKDVSVESRVAGAARVRMGSFIFEVTTFRTESDTSDGRIPTSVTFASREEDARRRDFTVNALYYQPVSRELYDPFEGEADVRDGLVQFIGDPKERIRHDALRIFRAIRLRCALNGQYHPETYNALRSLAANIQQLSGARQLEELEKLLKTDHAEQGLEDQFELGIMQHYLPELAACKGIAQPPEYHQEGDVWNHLLQCVSAYTPDHGADVRLAALLHDIGKSQTFSQKERIRFDHHASVSAKMAETILRRLQAPAKRIEKISWLIAHHMMMGSLVDTGDDGQDMNDDRKAHWYFHPWFVELLQIFWLDIAGTTPSSTGLYDQIVREYHHFLDSHPRPVRPLLDGARIMELSGLPEGKEVGELRDQLLRAQQEGTITQKREAEAFILSAMQKDASGRDPSTEQDDAKPENREQRDSQSDSEG